MDRYQTSQSIYDRYTDMDTWQQDASKMTGGDWLFCVLIAALVAGVFSIIRQGEYRQVREREAEDRARSEEIKREMAEIYRGKRR